MPILALAVKSLLNRRLTALLMILSISLSVMLLLGVERLRTQARAGFANTISGTDLVVGARTGATALLLHAVFRIGYATNNVSWTSYQEIARHPRVRWTIPLSLGDSHRGFAVLGTSPDYFRHYHYARNPALELAAGTVFDDVYDAVLGADVARGARHAWPDPLVVAHGAVDTDLTRHDDKPFRVVGILRKTGTPVDRTVHVTLAGLEAIHVDWQSGMQVPGAAVSAEEARRRDLTPQSITAFLSGSIPAPRSSTCSDSSTTIARSHCWPSFPGWCCRSCGTRSAWPSGPARGLGPRRPRRPVWHGHRPPHRPQRAPARDGGAALRRRAAAACPGPDRR